MLHFFFFPNELPLKVWKEDSFFLILFMVTSKLLYWAVAWMSPFRSLCFAFLIGQNSIPFFIIVQNINNYNIISARYGQLV